MRAFLSHSSSDKALVEAIHNELGKDAVWLDKAEIEWGELFLEKISEGIENTSDFVLFWSSSAKRSDWVRLELNMAFIRMLHERAIRLKVLLLDKTSLPLYLKPYHFIDVSGSSDPVEDILKRLKPALQEPVKAQRHRFLNRNRELERIELAIDDSETSLICITGFQGIGKASIVCEAIRRFYEGSAIITIEVTGGTDLAELSLRINAHARKVCLSDRLSKTEIEQELALGIETISKVGSFLVLKNVQHWLDEDARPATPLIELMSILKSVSSFRERPVFFTTTRRINTDLADSGWFTQIFIDGLIPRHIATLIRLWHEITEGSEISQDDSLTIAKELYGHPVAAKLAAGLIGQYGVKYLHEFPYPLVELRRDLARYLISEVSLSNNTRRLMEFLAIVRKALPASIVFKALEITEEDFHQSINQASQFGFLMHGQALEAHPLLLDYFWRTSWARDDYKPFAERLAETVWDYSRGISVDSVEFCELLTVSVRLYALAGKVDRALEIRQDLMGEIGQAAIDHYNRRNYDLSQQMIDIVLSVDSKHWRMRLYKARIQIRREQWKEADQILKELIAERPNDKGAIHAQGWRYLRSRNFEEALQYFSKVISIDDHVRSLRDAAECLHELLRDEEALHFLSRAKRIESENPYILDLEARIYEKNGEFDLAYEAAKIAAIRNPIDWSLQHRLGRILMALDNAYEAKPYFEKAVDLAPYLFTPRSSLIDAMLDLKDDNALIRIQMAEAKRSAQTPMDHAVAENLEARCLIVEGKLEEAGLILEKELSHERSVVLNSSLLAEVMLLLHDKEKYTYPASATTYLDKARIAIKKGLRYDPNNIRLNDLLDKIADGEKPQ